LEHQKFTALEIGSQALFLHGIDVLFSSRSIKIVGINIPLPQIAPRDQKRLLSSIALAPFIPPQPSWDRLRRNATNKLEDTEPSNDTWNEDTLLRETSTNSSFSSTSATFQSTALTSPTLTEVDSTANKDGGLPTPPPTAGAFSSALQFIPSSVVAKPAALKEDTRSRSGTIDELMEKNAIQLDRSRSCQSDLSNSKDDNTIDQSRSNTNSDIHINTDTSATVDHLPILSPTLEVQSIPSRKSSFTTDKFPSQQLHFTGQIPSRKSSFKDIDDISGPRLPSNLIDKPLINNIQRKTSSTWPRSLGKKVAPWTSHDATKTSILGTTFDGSEQNPNGVVVPPRRMKVLKPVASRRTSEIDSPEGLKVDIVRVEVTDGGNAGGQEEHQKGGQVASKNVGGGAFHWMK